MKPCAEHRLGFSLGNDGAAHAERLTADYSCPVESEQQDDVGVERFFAFRFIVPQAYPTPRTSIEDTAVSLSQPLQRTTGVFAQTLAYLAIGAMNFWLPETAT
jgi:hypothetical protein